MKYFSTELVKDQVIKLNTGSIDDHIEIKFVEIKSANSAQISFCLSENVIVEKTKKLVRKKLVHIQKGE